MTEEQLILIDSFKIDFGELRELIAKTVEEKMSLVTPETIQPAKTLAADFRKTSKALMAAWREKRRSKALMAAWREKRTLSIADVLKADDEVKTICGLLEDGATNISEQVKKIEQETGERNGN